MSSSCWSSSKSENGSTIVEEELENGTRCDEQWRGKDRLLDSPSHSFKNLRLHEKSFSGSHSVDRMHVENLERELMNSCQQIDYLQDQLNARDIEVDNLSVHVNGLELKLASMESIEEEVAYLREELKKSRSECLLLMQEVENREAELQNSALCIERLEASISSLALEYQCEIESMKLDMVALEEDNIEAGKIHEQNSKEKFQMNEEIKDLQMKFEESLDNIQDLEEENRVLREKYAASQRNMKEFCQKIKKYLESNDQNRFIAESCLGDLMNELSITKAKSCTEGGFEAVLKITEALLPDGCQAKKIESMAEQLFRYEHLVKQLKEELREEKLKAKEEAEDLTQEMAELRYRLTCLLEEESKRRACVEQASLQRIAELEAQVKRESSKTFPRVTPLN